MAFILDSSVAVAWVVGKQATAYSRNIRLRARREPYHAPALWRQDVVNVIRSLTRRRAMPADAGRTAVDILERVRSPKVIPGRFPAENLSRNFTLASLERLRRRNAFRRSAQENNDIYDKSANQTQGYDEQ
jgi:predicted nucleic acid-binding protein